MVARSSADPLVPGQQVEAALHAGEHAERQAIDLHEPERVDVVLVPLDHLPVLHRGGLDRHQLVEPVVGQHEAAGMLRQVARRADQLAGQIEGQAQAPVVEVEVQLGGVLRLDAFRRSSPRPGEESSLIRSSGRPSALPTSRSAPLAR